MKILFRIVGAASQTRTENFYCIIDGNFMLKVQAGLSSYTVRRRVRHARDPPCVINYT